MNDKKLASELTNARQLLGEWITDNAWNSADVDINFLLKLEGDMFEAIEMLERSRRY
tara:strand:+ start:201 stop:371 length:171 start_codon:yes stop_codon:yes gene_type:complete